MRYCNANAMQEENDSFCIIIFKKEKKGDSMKKFQIPAIPPTTNKCVRFPNDVIERVENAINGKQCTFSAFVVEAVRIALENLEEAENNESTSEKKGESV